MQLSDEGIDAAEIRDRLAMAKGGDIDWKNGRVGAYIHYAGEDVLQVAKDAYLAYFSENGLGSRAFPSLVQLEKEVIDMTLGLLHGSKWACGSMTTGGTESIFLAMKSARDRAVSTGSAKQDLQVIAPRSAHPAFDKAAHSLGMQVVRVPVNGDFCADVAAMEAAVTPETVMLVGSAPAFPHGVIDPISDLAELARQRKVWLHVDACVGGFIAPFAKTLGAGIPDFDFSIEGVTSISADLHKYGFAAKGASTVLYARAEDFAFQAFKFDDWQRGAYATQTFVGTRPGGAIAAAWAVMNYLGKSGYLGTTRRILAIRESLEEGLRQLGLQVFGNPKLGIVSFGGGEFDIPSIAKAMEQKGWLVGRISEPQGLHLMLNLTHEAAIDQYLDDLRTSIEEVRAGSVATSDLSATY